MLLNDLVLRQVVPGWWTGKISDAGFVIVAPVALAWVLVHARLPGRVARPVALGATVAFYVVLQLWPPLGAWFSAAHVADLEDLIVLPFAVGAIVAWRGTRREASAVALLPLAGALAATTPGALPIAESFPCGDQGMPWEAAEPLRIAFEDLRAPQDYQLADFLAGMSLEGPSGAVDLVVATHGDDVAVCAKAGLDPDTEYTWTLGPWDETRSNYQAYWHGAMDTVVFRTTSAEGSPAADGEACAALATAVQIDPEHGCNAPAERSL